jgi:hypothetical protein
MAAFDHGGRAVSSRIVVQGLFEIAERLVVAEGLRPRPRGWA